MRALLLCSLLTLGACGVDGTQINVTVSGRPAEAQRLRVSVRLGDKLVMNMDEVMSSPDFFGLILPAGAAGFFDLRLDGLGAAGTPIGRGCTNTMLTGRSTERLKVEMYPLPSDKDTCRTAAGGS